LPTEVDCSPLEAECPPEGNHQVPNPDGDCDTYVLCLDGDPVGVAQCPEGWKFDIIDHICKPEDSAICA
jgi:hypothetical protein